MAPSKITATANKCMYWFYGPQKSLTNASYNVGGTGMWFNTLYHCEKYFKYPDLTIEKLTEGLDNIPEMKKEIHDLLQKCGRITEVLLIHSAFINTYGMHSIKPLRNLNALFELYEFLYEETKKILLKPEDDIDIFVEPEIFPNLINMKTKRPDNLVILNENKIDLIDKEFKLNTKASIFAFHLIDKKLRICTLISPSVQSTPFDKVDNDIFKPLADAYKCIYKNLKQKLKESYIAKEATVYESIFATPARTINNIYPILIKDVPDTYLSQFIEKLIPPLYKPPVVESQSTDPADIIETARANMNLLELNYATELPDNIFTTKLRMANGGILFPVIYLDKKLEVANENDIMRYYKNVINELFTLGVFKKINSTSSRYVINTEFDIKKLECMKGIPENEENKALFKNTRDFFFIYVGNLINFALVNKIPLPFKISRIYLLVFLGALKIEDDDDSEISLETKLIYSCIYLMEKASPKFLKTVLNIMEKPEKYKNVGMNSFANIAHKDFPIYSEDYNDHVEKLIAFIFINAYNEYMEIKDGQELKPEIQMFYRGLIKRISMNGAYTNISQNLMARTHEINLQTLNTVDTILSKQPH
jgi:hypothetical protein